MAQLQVEAVSKRFGGLQALSAVTLAVEAREILGLIGPNGAGKTTLFGVISGFVAPDAGRVRLDAGDLTGLPPHLVCRRGVARTFQLAQPFPELTVLENVMVGAFVRRRTPAQAREHARAILALTRLDGLADRPAQALSVGLRKRLELARALATGPRVLLLDEVMAGLNPTEVAETVDVVRGVRDGGVAVVVIEHVMAAVMDLSDRIAVLHHGQLIATGTPDQVARDPAVIQAYLGEDVAA
jgi:branched-chain amino acid transport system ATP-binding protein